MCIINYIYINIINEYRIYFIFNMNNMDIKYNQYKYKNSQYECKIY